MNDLARLGSVAEAPARFTIDEFIELANSPALQGAGKLELVEGVIVRMIPALSQHMKYQKRLFLALHDAYSDHPDNWTVQFELSIQLGPATLRDADVGVLSEFPEDGRYADPARTVLIVEIAHATLEKDLGAKRLDYASAGIPHYWVVDVEGRRVHTMAQPLDGDYAERHPVAFGEPLPVPGTDRTIVVD